MTTPSNRGSVRLPGPVRVLVVDDDENSRDLVDQLLSEAGYEVVTARNGVEALEIAATNTFSIAVVDLTMPRMGGIELCTRLRQQPNLPELRILVLSAVDVLSEQLKSLKAGADDFMAKPLEEQILLRKLKHFSDVIRMHGQLAKLTKK